MTQTHVKQHQISETEQVTIQVNSVKKKFGSNLAVNDLTFNVRKGEVIGFLGPNGSGKTTTMRLLTSFYTPDSGTIFINGLDTQNHDLETRSSIGYLPENNPLYEDLLVKEYLGFVADLRGMSSNDKKRNLERTVKETGLEEVYYRPINELSKGYHQRVGLAQAILHEPSILILDEPTEGLDPNQRIGYRNLVKTLGEDRTVLLSTHVMQEVETTCERVLLINKGILLADSPVSELVRRAKGIRSVIIELCGKEVEEGLANLPNLESLERLDPMEDRQRFSISTSGDDDPRPKIFQLAKELNWELWELREETARLEDVFHSLTTEQTVI